MDAGGRMNQETESRMFQDGHDCMDAEGTITGCNRYDSREGGGSESLEHFLEQVLESRVWNRDRERRTTKGI